MASPAPQVTGVREAIKALQQVEPKLKRAAYKNMRTAAQPLKSAAQARIPSSTPMSGWTRGRYAFDGGAKAGVKIKIGGRASSKKSVWPLVEMSQTNAGGAVFDMAGRRSSGKSPQGRQFIANLNRFGGASRAMWPAAEQNIDEVQKAVLKAIDEMAAQVNRDIGQRGFF